jgi:hypothetical protein
MDTIISFFAYFITIYDLKGYNGPLRQTLAVLWIVALLVTLAVPTAIQLYERDKIVHIRRILYVSVPLLVIATLGLVFFRDAPSFRWGSDWLVDKGSAQLTVCKIESPGANDTENVSYRARVHWLRPPTSQIATFHIGAINPNNELWPQVTSTQIVQGQDAQVDFVVSRRSMFPTGFAVVGLDQAAEETRANACRVGSSCYLQLPRRGVFRVSDEFIVNNFDEFVPRC